LSVADQKKRDTAVLTAWGDMDVPKKKEVLKDVVGDDRTDADVIGPLLLGNAATKSIMQEWILPQKK
jgi:hypothetical protein